MTQQKEPKDLSEVSDEELAAELARRRAATLRTAKMLAVEDAAEGHGHADGLETIRVALDQRQREQDGQPKPCPKCGRRVWVRSKNRERTVRTMSGEVRFCRHYHYCEQCQHGFYPLDIELGLPEEGEISPRMAARVLDFGVTSVFAEAAERWAVHHSGSTISENLVRLVVERTGVELEQRSASERQRSIRPEPRCIPSMLVVQTDGSMLPMREKSEWKEAKVGVIYNDDHHLRGSDAHRGAITEPRYAASMRGLDDFRLELDAALSAERALEARGIAWVADGAPWNWSLCDELCPGAVQVLDFMHMVEHAADCGKVVLGEQSPWLTIWTDSIIARINAGNLQDVLQDLREVAITLRADRREAVTDLIRYYKTNASRMNYPLYRQMAIPIGSGTVESAHRHVLQNRMKLAGQHWTQPNAHRMALLRCAYKTAGPKRFAAAPLPIVA